VDNTDATCEGPNTEISKNDLQIPSAMDL